MSPTNWTGIIGLCAVVTALIAVVGKTIGAGAYFGRISNSMENIDKNFETMVQGMKQNTEKLIEHDLRIYNLEKGRAPDQRPGLDFRRRRHGGGDS